MAVARAPRRLLVAPKPAPKHTPTAKEAPRANLRVVDRPARNPMVTTAIVVAGLFAVLFALVVFHTVMLQNQTRLDKLDDQVQTAQSNYEQLRLQVAQLEAPQRVVDAATQKLGMVPAAGTTYLTPSAADAAAASTPTTTTPSVADANDAAAGANSDTNAPEGNNDWPHVKPYLGSAQR
jgi:cell division protein FtsL